MIFPFLEIFWGFVGFVHSGLKRFCFKNVTGLHNLKILYYIARDELDSLSVNKESPQEVHDSATCF